MGFAGSAQAVELQLPNGARQMISRDTVQDRFFVPVAPFVDGALPTQMIEGTVMRSVWRIDVAGLTPLQLINPLRAQLAEAGYRVVLDCSALVCGGYDFRFAAEVLPAPNMYVNIRNFHVLSAVQGPEDGMEEAVTILASASSGASFVQIIQAGSKDSTVLVVADTPFDLGALSQGNAQQKLLEDGYTVLDGLDFGSGTSDLGAGPFGSLAGLAQALIAQPDLRIVLVGHTDNIGSLERNIELSRSRAASVREHMIDTYDIAPERLNAQGMGYLSPLTTNVTEKGRDINRRVEAVVLSQ
jgi:OOP family OmpA-OmpF porin